MLDIKFIRENIELVRNAIVNKGYTFDLDGFLTLEQEKRILGQQVEELRSQKNTLSSGGGKPDPETLEKVKQVKEALSEKEEVYKQLEQQYITDLKKIPNIPTSDTPIGHSEEENVVVYEWGNKRDFDFPIRNHAEIAALHGWIDKERAAQVAGSRFAYLMGDLVLLQFGMVQWVFNTLTDQSVLEAILKKWNINASSKPFIPVLPPYMIRTAPYDMMDRLEPREDRYKIEGQELWLQGSAEHVLGSMYMDEIFKEPELPVRYIGYATSFRQEAGTYGKDMEGIIRMHQFDKLEMESFSTAETSHDEHLFFAAIQEYFMQELNIPYRKLQKCTYDIGKPNAKGSDIEAWLPGQQKYRETHTADYMTDYQARRLNTRVKRSDGTLEYIHTNDATAFALGRAMVAILENYQQADGTVLIPETLQKYVGKTHIGTSK